MGREESQNGQGEGVGRKKGMVRADVLLQRLWVTNKPNVTLFFSSLHLFSFQAKLLEEMDEEFGVSNLVEQEFKQEKKVFFSLLVRHL